MSTRGLRKVIQEEMGRSLRQATVKSVHGDTVSVQVGGSPKYLRGLPVIGGVDNVVAGDTVVLYEADGRIYAEATKAKAGVRYGNKSGASVAAVMGPHTHLASSSGGVLSSYVRVDDIDTITVQHSFSPSSPQAPFLLGGNAQSQLVAGLRADQLNKSVLAGSGLAGGGVLTADRTLTVDLTHVFNWSGLHTFGAGIDVVGTVEFQTAGTINTLSGNLNISPAGDVVFNPTGNDLLPAIAYDLNVGSLSKKYLTLHCAELWVETLVAQDTIATIGGRILVGPTTVLTGSVCDEDVGIMVKHNEMAVGDRVYLEAAGKVEFMAITSGPAGVGPYSYGVTRDLDGTGKNDWYAGDAVFNTGTTGEGFIDLYSVHGVKAGTEHGPTIVGNVRLSTTYNDWAEHWAVGNLDGIYGYGATAYGLAAGKFADSCAWVSIDATNGFRVMYGATAPYALSQWDMSGNILVGRTGSGQSNVYISAGKLELRNNTTAAITLTASGALIIDKYGDMLFSAADGLLLLGPNCEISDSGWWSLRKQKATISGAFHQEAGRWLGTRGLVVEEATTNLVVNPSFETNLNSWNNYYSPVSRTRVAGGVFGLWYQSVQCDSALDGTWTDVITAVASTTYTASVWVMSTDTPTLVLVLTDQAGNWIESEVIVPTGTWQRVTVTGTTAADDTGVRLVVESNTATACTFGIDGAQIEQKGCATTYCDGSLGHEYTWSGTPHASTSARAATEVNLDAYAGEISGKNTLSFTLWLQMPYDANATWPQTNYNYFLDCYDSGSGHRIFGFYDSILDRFRLHYGTAYLTSGVQTFKAGDRVHIALTLDYAADNYNMYLNGALASFFSVACTTRTISQWNLGSKYSAIHQGGFVFDEFAAFGKVLSAAEVAATHTLQRPLVDAGAIDRPGIYILDGRFRMASSSTGARIEITADYIAGYSDATTKQFYIQASDGKAVFGGGKILLDATGIIQEVSSSVVPSYMRWVYDNVDCVEFWSHYIGSLGSATEIQTKLWARGNEVGDAPEAKITFYVRNYNDTKNLEVLLNSTDEKVTIDADGGVVMTHLAGTGTRNVSADANGKLVIA